MQSLWSGQCHHFLVLRKGSVDSKPYVQIHMFVFQGCLGSSDKGILCTTNEETLWEIDLVFLVSGNLDRIPISSEVNKIYPPGRYGLAHVQ